MSIQRICAVFKKDVVWSLNNLKLLGVMVLPAFIIVLFSKLDSEATFGYALIFANGFIGILTTSYLIIEEKNKGTLLALLTSPLTNYELLTAKFLFTLSLCLLFSVFAVLIYGRIEIFTNPLLFLNLIFFSGTTCFIGYTNGLFFKNEQEMSVFAPILMLFFIIGETIGRASSSGNIHGYFPDYHLSQLISGFSDIPKFHWIGHTLFNGLYFFTALIVAGWYTRFYFANNQEKRGSKIFAGWLAVLAGLFVLSGKLSPSLFKSKDVLTNTAGMAEFPFESQYWRGKIHYDPKVTTIDPVINGKNRKRYRIEAKDKKSELSLSLRKMDEVDNSAEKRDKKVREDKSRFVIGSDNVTINGTNYKKWHYFKKSKMVVLAESFCQDQLLQVAGKIEDPNLENITKTLSEIDSFLKKLESHCPNQEFQK